MTLNFHDRVWYYNQKKIKIDGSGSRLARWLGVAHWIVGSDLCYWLLLESGKIIARTTVQHVVLEDYLNDDVKLEIDYGDMDLPGITVIDNVNDGLMDNDLNAELIVNVGTGHERKGRVVKRAKGTSGEPIGRAHANPLFNTREYMVKFTDGSSKNYFANVIAECMYTQIDS